MQDIMSETILKSKLKLNPRWELLEPKGACLATPSTQLNKLHSRAPQQVVLMQLQFVKLLFDSSGNTSYQLPIATVSLGHINSHYWVSDGLRDPTTQYNTVAILSAPSLKPFHLSVASHLPILAIVLRSGFGVSALVLALESRLWWKFSKSRKCWSWLARAVHTKPCGTYPYR